MSRCGARRRHVGVRIGCEDGRTLAPRVRAENLLDRSSSGPWAPLPPRRARSPHPYHSALVQPDGLDIIGRGRL